jgi:methylase of polypeptide subunit release factors
MNFNYKIYSYLIRPVRSIRLIHRYLFGYLPSRKSESHGAYWDWTTLVMRRAIVKYINSDTHHLDVGTGSVGCLAIYSCLRSNCSRIDAVDYIQEVLDSARECSNSLRLPIQFYWSDLFSNIKGKFDVITFNAPYIDKDKGDKLGLFDNKISEARFSGGTGGGETIARFLFDAKNYMKDDGKILLGVCHYHISKSKINDLIIASGLELHDRIQMMFMQSSVYILQKE